MVAAGRTDQGREGTLWFFFIHLFPGSFFLCNKQLVLQQEWRLLDTTSHRGKMTGLLYNLRGKLPAFFLLMDE